MNYRKIPLVILVATCIFASGAIGGDELDTTRNSVRHAWKAQADYPATGVPAIDNAVARWVAGAIRTHLAGASAIDVDPSYPGDNWDLHMDYVTSRPSGNAVSIVFETVVSPEKAAHPMTYIDVLNFDTRSGAELAFDDLFGRPPAALRIMAKLAPERVGDELRQRNPALFSHLDETTFFMNGFEPNRENFAALILEPNGVRVVFQRYQVLPYVFGNVEAAISLEELADAEPNLELWGK